VTVLFGPSGVGKTTILRCIAGLDAPTSGRIAFGGDTWDDAAGGVHLPPQRRRVGYLAQDPALFPNLTVRDNVAFGLARLPRLERDSRVDALLGSFGLRDLAKRRPAELSGGQRHRAALARALAPRPRLLLLDEPLASLDVPARNELLAELGRALRAVSAPAVLVTHDWTLALAMGDELAVLGRDGILQTGAPREIFSRPGSLDVAAAVGVETIVPCRVEHRADGIVSLAAAGLRIHAVDPATAETGYYACLRGEDVTLEKGAASRTSARNHLAGWVREIVPSGPILRVAVDVGFTISALVTRPAAETLALAPGDPVTVQFKASAVHLIPHVSPRG
jgi:molybdate transport system ATP-binding protein